MAAEASEVSGRLSLDLDQWRVPTCAAAGAAARAGPTVHAIQLDAGPLTKAVASVLQLQAPAIRLIHNSVAPFLMAHGRVEHRDLVFRLKNTTVETSGSVGLDQSLDMMVAISLSGSLLGNGPLAEAIRQHPIRLPLRGTLSHPRIEPAALRSANGGRCAGRWTSG